MIEFKNKEDTQLVVNSIVDRVKEIVNTTKIKDKMELYEIVGEIINDDEIVSFDDAISILKENENYLFSGTNLGEIPIGAYTVTDLTRDMASEMLFDFVWQEVKDLKLNNY